MPGLIDNLDSYDSLRRHKTASTKKRGSAKIKPTQSAIVDTLEEMRMAYADTGKQRDTYPGGARNLGFLSSAPVPAAKLYNYLKYIGQYNEFKPSKATEKIIDADPKSEIWIGREGSVVLYIKPSDDKAGDRLYKGLVKYADEVGFVSEAPSRSMGEPEYKSGSLLRVWWD
jgi:hypothetical protein